MRIKINDLPKRYQDQVRKTMVKEQRRASARLGVSSKTSHLESHPRNEPVVEKKTARLNGQVGIDIVEYRHRRTDYGGSSEKYLVDAIVTAGILPDDKPEIVKWIKKEQFKISKDQQERTVVLIWSQ